ncbi:MAG: S41 family peptidase [Minisyncoccia bacterium]
MNFIKRIIGLFILLVILSGVVWGGVYYYKHSPKLLSLKTSYKTVEENDLYVRFDMEAYDKIAENYWMKTKESDLVGLFQLSLQKTQNLGTLPALASTTRAGVAKMLFDAINLATSTDAKKNLALGVLNVALYNLAPAGRDGLLSSIQQKQLQQEVTNVNPEKDLYKDLGVAKGAPTSEVETAYIEKKEELTKIATPEAKVELEKVTYAHQVLTDKNNKNLYDQAQIEPTVWKHVIGKTLYLSMSKISPNTLQEFAKIIDGASTTPGLDSMILDLRGNIGGALDFAPAFIGLFIGPNQYAFDLFHQDEYKPQRSTIGKYPELSRFADIAIITDNMTQSTAEVITAMFKRFNLGHVVGTNTRGWGTVENTFPIDTVIDSNEKYTMLLVQYLTLREDGQPIDGRGVDPHVNINDKSWKTQVSKTFKSQSLVDAVLKQAVKPPLR